jgi:hypothetical protein
MWPDIAGSMLLDDAIGVSPEAVEYIGIAFADATLFREQRISVASVAMHVHHHSQQRGDLQGVLQVTLVGDAMWP